MERSEILDMMSTLQLAGMRAAYDEIVSVGIKRQHSVEKVIGALLKAEIMAHCLTRNVTQQADRQDWESGAELDRCRLWRDRSAWARGARFLQWWWSATDWRSGWRKGGSLTNCVR